MQLFRAPSSADPASQRARSASYRSRRGSGGALPHAPRTIATASTHRHSAVTVPPSGEIQSRGRSLRVSAPLRETMPLLNVRGSEAGRQSSICAPSSTTRLGGSAKNEVAVRALRDITEKRCSRQIAIPGRFEGISVSRPRK
jgi:hypothetical protein